MAILVQQSEATAAQRRMYFHCVDATDGITAEVGEAGGQSQISINGGAWGNTTNTLTAIGNGRYYVEITAAELGTVGIIEGRYKSAATAESVGTTLQVVPYDPYDATRMGLTALPNANADAAGGLPISDAGGLDMDATDSNISVITAFWNVFILTSGTIGAVGNDTTHLHLTGQTYGNDELNDYIIVVYDNSEGEYHSVWITDWVLATALATTETLPFTPQDSTDTYWVFSLKKHPDIASILAGTVTNAQGADVATDVANMIDANNRVDVGSWLGQAVTLSTNNAPDVNINEISDDQTAAANLELFTEVLENGTGLIDSGTFKAGAINAAAIATDAVDADALAADALTEIQASCNSALVALQLDHLLGVDTTVAADGDLTAYCVDGSIMSHLLTAGANTSDYNASTDSQEAIANALSAGTFTNVGLDTTLAVRTSETVFTMNAGHNQNDAYNNMVLALQDVTDSHWEVRKINDYAGASKTITVDSAFTFVVAANDVIKIFLNAYAPTVAAGGGATAQQVWEYDVSSITTDGYAGTYQQIIGGRYG
jgi:hypothetical protein